MSIDYTVNAESHLLGRNVGEELEALPIKYLEKFESHCCAEELDL